MATQKWKWSFIHVDNMKYQRSFRYCKLTYNPKKFTSLCSFVVYNDITLILYKGGTIEKDLCKKLDIDCLNIECFPELQKASSHDPCQEVQCYYHQLKKILH